MSSQALPRWARAADFLALLFVVVALTITISGGFRLRLGTTRIALTSPYRLLLLAAAVAAVRHLLAPQEPVYRHLRARILAWCRSAPLRAAATTVLGVRPAILFAGLLAVLMIGYPREALDERGRPPLHDYDSELLDLQLRWDAGWYLQIAMNGYAFNPETGTHGQQSIVFFPAYPLMTRVIALLFGNREVSYIAAGTLVSLAGFLLALAYLYRLAREQLDAASGPSRIAGNEHETEQQAAATLWLLACYPFALFYGAIYTESLYLLGVVGAFYHFRRHEFGRAGAWGWMVGLTRANGCFLSVPLALLAIEPWLPPRVVRARRPIGFHPQQPEWDRRSGWARLAAAAMPGTGMLTYSVYVRWLTGAPFTWAAGHAAWGRHYGGLTRLVTDRYDYIAQAGLSGYVTQLPNDLLNVLGVLFVLVSAWPVMRRFGLAYGAFILVNILPPLAAGGLLSAGRFSSVLFPSFIWLASAVPARHQAAWIASFAAIQAVASALFYTWRPMF